MDEEVWYYCSLNGVAGPVRRGTLNDLLRTRSIFDYTPVWRSGLSDWVRLSDSMEEQVRTGLNEEGGGSVAGAEEPPECEVGVCSFSGELRFRSELLPYGNSLIAPEYKDRFVQSSFEAVESDRAPLGVDMSILTCWKQAWMIFKDNVLVLSLAVTVIFLPAEFFFEWAKHSLWAEDGLLAMMVETVTDLFTSSLAASVVYTVSAAAWRNEVHEVGEVLAGAWKKFGAVLMVNFLLSIAVFVGGIMLLIPGLYFAFRCAFALPLVFAEDPEYGMEAITGSWQMVAGRQLRLLAFTLGFVVVFFIPIIGLGALFYFLSYDFWPFTIASGFVGSILYSYGMIYWYCVFEHFEQS